jgi:hypothetical protein
MERRFGTAGIGGAAATDIQSSKSTAVMPSVCVLDGALLDIESIAPLFERLFENRKALRESLRQLILYSGKADPSKARGMPAGSFIALASGAPHFVSVDEKTVVQRNHIGPCVITYIDPNEDPRRKPK